MKHSAEDPGTSDHAVTRLAALSPVSEEGLASLRAAPAQRLVRARREVIAKGAPVDRPLLLLSGWACRTRILIDGRRQILNVILPGDLIGSGMLDRPVAIASVLALTDVVVGAAPDSVQNGAETGLARAYATSEALDQHHLLLQVARLGRMNALERVVDWILELRERQILSGLWSGRTGQLPLTQETIADALGLTSVHVNRTLQALRRDGLLELRSGMVTVLDAARLAAMVDHQPPRLTAGEARPR